MQLDPQVRVVPEVGGVMLFSGNQLHSTVPNTSGLTRFSIDFRTVDIDDVQSRREAPNFDSECTGTSLRDFLRAGDFEPIMTMTCLAHEGRDLHVCEPRRNHGLDLAWCGELTDRGATGRPSMRPSAEPRSIASLYSGSAPRTAATVCSMSTSVCAADVTNDWPSTPRRSSSWRNNVR